MAVKDVMSPTPTALPTDAPLAAAARAMRDLDVGAVVVMENDRPLGIVTDRDIVVRALARGRGVDAATVGDICSRDLITVPAGASVEDALGVMAARGVRRLPVTIARGSVVGIVSIDDLVDAGGASPPCARSATGRRLADDRPRVSRTPGHAAHCRPSL
jgi:CBS domain-containing protein